MRAIGIFCASSRGTSEAFLAAARAAGTILAERGLELVYGGGRAGLMGEIADAVLAAGGRATGVMTRALVDSEIAHTGLSTLHVVEDMHARKTRMAQLADGFVALPGGPGTLEEMFEQWTWALLGLHAKPCGFLDVDGYFAPLRTMIDRMGESGFLRDDHRDMLAFAPEIGSILDRFDSYVPPRAKYG